MEVAERASLPKSERLFLKKDIDRLFDEGRSFIAFPLRIVYVSDVAENNATSGISILVSVPKKRIKRAVGRNLIKRLIRENFRLQKKNLSNKCSQNGKYAHIAFMYIQNEICSYSDIKKAIKKAITLILKNMND